MKKKIILVASIILVICAYSFNTVNNVEYKFESFTKIKLMISAKLYVEQGNTEGYEIDAPSEVKDEILTEVKNGTLEIKFRKPGSWMKIRKKVREEGIVIHVTMKEVEGLAVTGSGDIIAEGNIESDEIGFKVSGSGAIDLKYLKADDISASVSGSGDILIDRGDADDMSIAVSGSGDVDFGSINADDATVKVSGSGSIVVGEVDHLSVTVSGSGDIYYKGSPEISKKVSGSGSIKRVK